MREGLRLYEPTFIFPGELVATFLDFLVFSFLVLHEMKPFFYTCCLCVSERCLAEN